MTIDKISSRLQAINDNITASRAAIEQRRQYAGYQTRPRPTLEPVADRNYVRLVLELGNVRETYRRQSASEGEADEAETSDALDSLCASIKGMQVFICWIRGCASEMRRSDIVKNQRDEHKRHMDSIRPFLPAGVLQ